MSSKSRPSARPGWRWPETTGWKPADHAAFLLGSGFYSGCLRPAPGTWGSVVGFLYAAALLQLPNMGLYWAITVVVVLISVPLCGKSARLLNDPDPGTVVLDEIAAAPLALWPAFGMPLHGWEWVLAFAVYRVADISKVWPASALEKLPGGWGIMMDDVASAMMMGILWALLRHFLAPGF